MHYMSTPAPLNASSPRLVRAINTPAAQPSPPLLSLPPLPSHSPPLPRLPSPPRPGADSSLQRRAIEKEARERQQRIEEKEQNAAADAAMLLDFTEVMKGGVFVQARSSFMEASGSGFPRFDAVVASANVSDGKMVCWL